MSPCIKLNTEGKVWVLSSCCLPRVWLRVADVEQRKAADVSVSDGAVSERAVVSAGGGTDHMWTAAAPSGQDQGAQEDLQVRTRQEILLKPWLL